MTRAFLQTRGSGRAGDYTFLGYSPQDSWWRAYRDVTAFDHPTVLVVSDGESWSAYLSGIPSARVDAVGTVVRYTLVLDGPCGAPETDGVLAGVAAWCDAVGAGPPRPGGALSAALDERFPDELVDRMITDPFPGRPRIETVFVTDATVVNTHVLQALRTLPGGPPAAGEPGDWVGGVGAPACRTAFVARVGLLLHGAVGRALLLNLVGGPDDAAALLDDTSLAVLVDGDRPARPTALRSTGSGRPPPVVEAKKAQAPAPSRTETATVLAMMAFAVLVTTLAAVVILLL